MGGLMKHFDNGDCDYCPAYFTLMAFVMGMLVGYAFG